MRLILCLALLLAVACGPTPAPTPAPSASPSASSSPSASAQSPDLTISPEVTPSPLGPETLAQYARRIEGAHSYGVYMGGKKVGWASMDIKLGRHKGVEVLTYSEEFHLELQMAGQKNTMRDVSQQMYALTGDGPIVAAHQRMDEDGTVTEVDVKPTGQELEIALTTGGRTTKRKVKVERDTLRQALQFERWLRTARKGDKLTQWSTDWLEDPVEREDKHTYQAREQIVWGGVRTEINRVRLSADGGNIDALLQNDGTPWKATMGGLIEMRAENAATARHLDKPVDMLEVTAVKVQRPVDRPADLERLVLEVSGVGDFKLPASHRQKAYVKDGVTYWELRRDFRVQGKAPLTASQRAELLKSTPALEADDELRALARKIAGKGTPVQQADRLQDWIFTNLEKTYSRNATTARAILDNKAGDCTEHARLFTAMARSLGIPTREVAGLVSAAPNPTFAWHAWAEIHDGHQWVSVDPMWNEVYVDATHLKLSSGADDYTWVNVAGTMKLKIH